MAELHELIEKIENPELRAQIQAAADRLTKQKKFGLVFEEHLPECTPLYDIPVRKGAKVSLRNGKANETFTVLKIENGVATCLPKNSKEAVQFAVADLVTTAELGDPIYPCLQPLGEVCNAPDSELWHTLIEADNYHALQLLEYLYAGKVDCIYIDPPYNKVNSRDWKYNCNYVDGNDSYRHSKWLSMIQKRLRIAKKLLNPENSTLIVTIDEKEYLHLGCLLEEMFAGSEIEMITSVINPKGTSRVGGFQRVCEYIFIIRISSSAAITFGQRMLDDEKDSFKSRHETVRWQFLKRGAANHGRRQEAGNLFYPIIFDKNHKFLRVGDSYFGDVSKVIVPDDQIYVFPISKDGVELSWNLGQERFMDEYEKGYIDIDNWKDGEPSIKYLTIGQIRSIEKGELHIIDHKENGAVILQYGEVDTSIRPVNVWCKTSHDAGTYGSSLLNKFFINRRFSFPKSLYAVHDTIRFFVANKPNALIVDFFAGSGTTLHAVNLLNAEDGGHRRCIMVTNNEVSDAESKEMTAKGLKPGDSEWEKLGIARYVTWPRTVCSIKGENVNGEKLQDKYFTYNSITTTKKRSVTQISFVDPIFTLSLQDRKKVIQSISRGILPGKLVTAESSFVVSEDSKHTVSVLLDEKKSTEWIAELSEMDHIDELLVITKDKKVFSRIKKQIEETLAPIEQISPVMYPMSNGFKTNAVFFKLGFLDKTKVSLGMQFKELLSTLWMKAGAIGRCPVIDEDLPNMLILPENKMAILNDENRFGEFAEQLAQHPEIEVVYLVTDYESSFVAMTQALEGKKTYQLYKDYLDNFRINAGRNNG